MNRRFLYNLVKFSESCKEIRYQNKSWLQLLSLGKEYDEGYLATGTSGLNFLKNRPKIPLFLTLFACSCTRVSIGVDFLWCSSMNKSMRIWQEWHPPPASQAAVTSSIDFKFLDLMQERIVDSLT
jgi:hypothetical protein